MSSSLKHKFRPIQLDPGRVARAEAQAQRVVAEDEAALAGTPEPAAAFGTSQAAAATTASPSPKAPAAHEAAEPGTPDAATAHVPSPAAAVRVRPLAPAGSAPAPAAPALGTSQGPASDLATQAVSGWEIGRVYEVPHAQLRPNPVNPRIFYTAEAVAKMAETLQAEGQATAATGYVEDGHVVLIEGHTRQRAALQLGWPSLRVEIRPKPADLRALYEEARAANDARSNPSNLDEALRWKELLGSGVYGNQRALATAIRLHESEVSRILSLARMPQSILQALAEVPSLLHSRTLASVRAYWEACGDDRTLELVAHARSRGMGFREIDNLRRLAEKGPVKRPHASRIKVEFGGAKGELKTFEDGRIQLLLEGLNAAEAKELQQRLQRALEA